MPGCRSRAGLIMGAIAYLILLASYWRVSQPAGPSGVPGILAGVQLVYIGVVLAVALVYASLSVFHSPTLGLLSLASMVQLSNMVRPLDYSTLIPPAAGAIVGLALLLRRGWVDSVVELARGVFRPTPASMALASSILYMKLIDYYSWHGYVVHIAGATGAGLLYTRLSRSLYESILAGAVLGLGPLGSLLALAPQAFRPLPPLSCEGIPVGRLVGYTARSSPTRLIVSAGEEGIACSTGVGVMEAGYPVVIWLYSDDPLRTSSKMVRGPALIVDLVEPGPDAAGIEEEASTASYTVGQGGVGRIRLGSIEPLESRIAVASGILGSMELDAWVVIVGSRSMGGELVKLATSLKGLKRVIIAVDGLVSRSLAPAPPGYSSGLIVSRLSDPGDQEAVARSLLGGGVGVLRRLMDMGVSLGYPYCGGRVMAVVLEAETY